MKKNLLLLLLLLLLLINLSCEEELLVEQETKISLISITPEKNDNCLNGGYKIQTGIDINDDGILEFNEVQSTNFICNGTDGNIGNDGSSSLINISNEPEGTNCENGGYKIETGIDLNNNGTLESNEVQLTNFICNGTDGNIGNDGSSSLINISNEPEGTNCENGGYKIETGIDINNNGTLDSDEIETIKYICNQNITASTEIEKVDFSINLPDKLFLHSSYEFWLYADGIVSDYELLKSNPVTIAVDAPKIDWYEKGNFGKFTGNSKNLKIDLKFKKADEEKTIFSNTTQIIQTIKETGVTRRVLFITDSFFANQYGVNGILGEIDAMANADGNTLETVGTVNTYGYQTECRGGWNDTTFTTVGSPFFINGGVDFEEYLVKNNISGITDVVFFLGINGGFGEGIRKMIEGDSREGVNSNLKSVLPNANFYVSFLPPYWIDAKDQDISQGQTVRINKNKAYKARFDNRENENIFLIPMNNFHRKYGYRLKEVQQTQFTDVNQIIGDLPIPNHVTAFDHHPSTNGVKSIAYNVYNYLFSKKTD